MFDYFVEIKTIMGVWEKLAGFKYLDDRDEYIKDLRERFKNLKFKSTDSIL